ncbi:hypothetical protein [Desmospora profundinema]|uniref:PrgI family protein n=1 Tax=Desmospora profundinema TaxID=1571184 RepID=A0ABU1IS95_9BACL|nr:hypothetical protein [Desmospora profundinema]MDR6227571.1 hypothetical protein [Desmospora profundinema]
MAIRPVRDERTPYSVLLYRKNRTLRLAEIGFFLTGLLVVLPLFENLRSVSFMLTVLGWGGVVMGMVPAIWRVWKRPRYVLYEDRLVIHWGRRRDEVPLHQVKPTYDLPNQYDIRGKKQALLVTDPFLEDLAAQLELNKRGLKRRGS